MIDNRKDMSCEEFSACMPELVASGADLFAHPHVRRCKLHRALLEDLEAIARAARELFPEIDPPDSLWDGIQTRLDEENAGFIASDPWPGYRVVSVTRVIEHNDPRESPPAPEPSRSGQAPIHFKIEKVSRPPARRERGQ